MMKLFSQFEQVESATPLARREEGKISGLSVLFPSRVLRGVSGCRTRRKSPRNRTPARPEANHVEEEKGDADPALRTVGGPIARKEADEDGDDEVGDRHEEGAPEEEDAAA